MPHFEQHATVHAVFTRRALLSPSAVALCDGPEVTSYGDLERRSNQLARYLVERRGIGRDARVALLAQRSAETIVAMLAILKAGAAFVPLDPAYSCERLAAMLEDAAPALILGHAALSPDIATRAGERFVDTATACRAAEGLSVAAPPTSVQGDGAAYVMYTSGSTGRPKGVVVPHRAILRLVSDQIYARFAPDETFLHLAPLAFDASTFEIWGALLSGARLAIVPQVKPSLDDIVAALGTYGVTTAWFTAGLFHLLVDHRLEGLRPLRRILTGGDVVSPAHVRRARQALPDCRFVNGYGPTENTTFSCCHVIAADEDGALPIGRALAHSTAYVLDGELRPVADGEEGQLCVGGEGLASGYLNAPDLTAEKFRFVSSVGERLYLTGDVARRRPDGIFEFLGRMDQQVKIDGKRVEIDEIETLLRGEPGVADAAVVACGEPAARRLEAFLKPARRDARAGLAQEIADRLRRTLPGYMVPSRLHLVDELPLTVNGKVDRTRLAALAAAPAPVPAAAAGSPPASALEAAIAKIWSEVLELPQVPRDVNFFDLGGTSLRLMSLHARLATLGRPPLSPVELFDNPTIAKLAARLSIDTASLKHLAPETFARTDQRRAAIQRMRDHRLGRVS